MALWSNPFIVTAAIGAGSFAIMAAAYSFAKYERLMRGIGELSPRQRALMAIARRLQLGSDAGAFFVLLARLPAGEASGAALRGVLRKRDDVLPLEEGLWMVLVETDVSHSGSIGTRVQQHLAARGIAPSTLAVAAIPEDGLHGESLMAAAQDRLDAVAPGGQALSVRSGHPESQVPLTPAEMKLLDPVTGILRANHAPPLIRKFIARARRRSREVSMVLVNLEGFDRLITVHGKEVCDQLLKLAASVLERSVRGEDLIGGLSDMTFFVLCEGPQEAAVAIAERVCSDLGKESVSTGWSQVRMVVSAGISSCPRHTNSANTLIALADQAMLSARATGPNRFMVYSPALSAPVATNVRRADVNESGHDVF